MENAATNLKWFLDGKGRSILANATSPWIRESGTILNNILIRSSLFWYKDLELLCVRFKLFTYLQEQQDNHTVRRQVGCLLRWDSGKGISSKQFLFSSRPGGANLLLYCRASRLAKQRTITQKPFYVFNRLPSKQ